MIGASDFKMLLHISSQLKGGYGSANFLCQIKILHLWSFERPYIVSLKKYNYMLFSTPVAMETVQDGHQTTFLKSLLLQR